MGRKSVESCGNAQHTGAGDEDPVQGEGNTEELVAETSKKFATNVINAVDVRVVHLEYTNDVVRPTRHSSDDQDDDHTGDQAEAVEDRRNGKYTETNLSFQHKHSCAFPTDLLLLVTSL